MNIAIEIVLSIIVIFIGINVGNIYKRNKLIRKTMQDDIKLNKLIKSMYSDGVFNAAPEEISITGRFYTDNYLINIMNEIQSSKVALDKARNMLLIGLIIILAVSYYIGNIYIIINLMLFIIIALITPLGESAIKNAYLDVRSISWNLYHFYREQPKECEAFIKEAYSLEKVFKAIKEIS